MKLSNSFFITRRQTPKDESTIASSLLVKSGMVIKNDNGLYSYLPIGLKVLNNIVNIIKKQMSEINAFEVLLPVLSKYENSSNIEEYKIIDKNNNKYKLSCNSQDLFSFAASFKISSYRDLHFSIYQINNKFRDEAKTQYGLMRKKEFYMFDAYSFDSDEGGLDVSYDRMFLAFNKIFNKLLLDSVIIRSKEGLVSEEFQVITPNADNTLVKCSNCSYASSIENASSKTISLQKEVYQRKLKLIETPNKKTIKEVSEFLDVFPSLVLKSIVVKVDDIYKMILLKGESELNIYKLKSLLKNDNIELPSIRELEKIGTFPGYVGPINSTMEIIADNEVKSMNNFICGSNIEGKHYINVNYGRDFKINRFADLKLFDADSLCPKCKSKCEIVKGIEIGQITKLGTNLSKKYKLKYTNEVNEEEYVHLGVYQIGIDRLISAIVERHHDEKGIIWPMSVAPFKVAIIVSNVNDNEVLKYSEKLYEKLMNLGIDTILDDRKESIGVKFNDMDLIGIPLRITIGRKISENIVELKTRSEDKSRDVKTSKIVEVIQNIIEKHS